MGQTVILKNTTSAGDWADGYPLGNGRIGAMVWGTPTKEIASLNHDLLWRRYLRQPQYGTASDREEIRALCMEGRYQEALALCRERKELTPELIMQSFDMARYLAIASGDGNS